MAVCQKFFETFRTLLFIKISPDSACDGAFGGFQQRELTISLINNQLIVGTYFLPLGEVFSTLMNPHFWRISIASLNCW